MDKKEIEIKLQLDGQDYHRMIKILKDVSTLKSEKHQVDVYYSPENQSFYNCGDRCLRVRTEGKNSILSYKRIHDENTSKQFIEEYETHIESPEMLDCILKALNYKREIVVDKYRIEYCTDTGFLIALDRVTDLGFFIEIENRNESDTIENRNLSLNDFVRQLELDITRRNTEGYSNMMFKNGEKK